MRIVIASSKKWFKLEQEINENNEVTFIETKDQLTIKKLVNISPDFIFFPHWNWVVPESVFKRFKCVLFHTAPLPYGRGGSPIQNLIIRGFKEAPVCALAMGSELDAGDIYAHYNISLQGSLTEIFQRMNIIINILIKQIIREIPEPKKQNGKKFEFRRLSEKDNVIQKDFSIAKIYDYIRMLQHEEYPNPFIIFGDLKIEFSSVEKTGGKLICSSIISQKDI